MDATPIVEPGRPTSSPFARDSVFTGSVAELYDSQLVPMIFEPYADDLARRVRGARSFPGARACRRHGRGHPRADTGLARACRPACDRPQPGDARPCRGGRHPAAGAVGAGRRPAPPVRRRELRRRRLPVRRDVLPGQGPVRSPRHGACSAGRDAGVQRLGPHRGERVRRRRHDGAGPPLPGGSSTVHGAHAARLLRPGGHLARPGERGVRATPRIETVAARSRARTAREPAIAYCQGTPLRNEIEARSGDGLAEATEACTAAIADRFGAGPVDGKIQAHVVVIQG